MQKPSSYDLLLQINKSTSRLENKLDARINGNTKKIDVLEGKIDNLLGKIGIGVLIVSAFISGVIALCFDAVKNKFQ